MKRLTIQQLNYWLVLLTLTGCSNEVALLLPDTETVSLGMLVTRTGEDAESVAEWKWQKDDVITATTSDLSATYTYGDTEWGEASNNEFTVENLGLDAITLEFGNSVFITDQSVAANYRKADYLKGIGTVNFLTIEGTLAHQYCDLVLNITQGTGWTDDNEFTNAMTAATCVFVAGNGGSTTDVTPFHDGSTFRAIFPPDNMVKGENAQIATLTFGTSNTPELLKGQKATIAYTNTYSVSELSNKRFIINAQLNTDCSVSSIAASVNPWVAQDVENPYPGELVTTP